jgi:EF hand
MKITKSLLAAALAAVSLTAIAQDGGRPPGPEGSRPEGGRPPRMPNPVIEALDANHDGVIDATEIDNAAVALRKLDKNGDGQLTQDELRPARPEGGRGPGGPGGPGGPEGGPGKRGPRGEGRPQQPPADQ